MASGTPKKYSPNLPNFFRPIVTGLRVPGVSGSRAAESRPGCRVIFGPVRVPGSRLGANSRVRGPGKHEFLGEKIDILLNYRNYFTVKIVPVERIVAVLF